MDEARPTQRLDKLFAQYVPDDLKKRTLANMPPRKLAKALVTSGIRPGNLRTLRAFIGQIYERANDLGAGVHKFEDEFSKHFWTFWEKHHDVPFPELRNLKREDYQRVFDCLEQHKQRWQQALCIRLYFEVGAPLGRLMDAEWCEIYDGVWYPYLPEDKQYWFESRERLNERALALVGKINAHVTEQFSTSRYLFPSASSGGEQPISAVNSVWRRII